MRALLIAIVLVSLSASNVGSSVFEWACWHNRYEAAEPGAMCTQYQVNRETKGDRQ